MATDIVLNAQVSDGFSGSIQEHICAKNIVIVGDWLKYPLLDESGIFYLKSRIGEFGNHLQRIVGDIDKYRQLTAGNDEKICRLSSWKSRLPLWLDIYSAEKQKTAGKLSVNQATFQHQNQDQ
jgi:hypothetical protein